jgi:DNA-binding transcriptional LysR family regulator
VLLVVQLWRAAGSPCGEIIGRVDAADAEPAAVVGLQAGRVRVAAFQSALSVLVPPAAAAMRRLHPGIDLRLSDAHPTVASQQLRDGEVDVAIVLRYDDTVPDDAIRYSHLIDDPMYLLSLHTGETLTDHRDSAWIAGCQHCRGEVVQICEAAGFTPHIAYTSDDIIVDQALVAAGLGVTTMPGLALSSYQADGVRASGLTGVQRRVYVATFGTPPDPPATTAFVTALSFEHRFEYGVRSGAALFVLRDLDRVLQLGCPHILLLMGCSRRCRPMPEGTVTGSSASGFRHQPPNVRCRPGVRSAPEGPDPSVEATTSASYPPPGPPRNTLAMAPASAVSIAAATGANKAAKGIRVGSVPVTITGRVMARIVASAQIPSVATDSPIQMGCHLELPRSRPIAHSKTRVPIPPQNQVAKAATGRCCCSEPETRSGASKLISSTAIQIPPIPIAVHSIQDRSAVVVRRPSEGVWSFIWCPPWLGKRRPPSPSSPSRSLPLA